MTTVQYNPLDPAVRANPYPMYHQLRADDPVRPSEFVPDIWILLRYADVAAVLRDPRFSSDQSKAGEPLAAMQVDLGPLGGRTMLTSDPPDQPVSARW